MRLILLLSISACLYGQKVEQPPSPGSVGAALSGSISCPGGVCVLTEPFSLTSPSSATDGATLGPELTSSSGWTSTGWTGSYNSFTHTAGNTSALFTTGPTVVANSFYHIVVTLTGVSAGSITVSIGSTIVSSSDGTAMASNGTYTMGPQAIDTGVLTITPTSPFNGTVAVSVKLITPSAASPINIYDSGSNLIESLSQIAAVHQSVGVFTPSTLGAPYTGNGFGTLITTGSYNTSFGPNCPLCSVTTGRYNTAIGGGTLRVNSSGWNNTAVGDDSMAYNTTGYSNTAMGVDALYNNTTGAANTCVGFVSCILNTTGSYNTGFGLGSLNKNLVGINNVGVGYNALNATTASNNTAVGYNALVADTTGASNTAVGQQALTSLIGGASNTAVGMTAGFSMTSASGNTILGYGAGYTETPGNANVSGANNIYIGYNAGPGTATQLAGTIVIGVQAHATTANTAVIGPSGLTDVYFGSTTPTALTHSKGSQIGGTLYSVAGTPLPACAAGTLLQRLGVSDATSITPGTTYTGSSTFTVSVECVFNSSGSVYTWIID